MDICSLNYRQDMYQYRLVGDERASAREVSQSKLHVSCRLKVNSRNSTIIHLESSISSQNPKKEVECAGVHVHLPNIARAPSPNIALSKLHIILVSAHVTNLSAISSAVPKI